MIIDLQRRIAEIGRIRIGEQVATSTGKKRPAKLATFRLTSQDPQRIRLAAELFGGQPRRWESPAGPAFEVITEADALQVMVPPSDMAFSQHYELWSAGGCQRRCDGETESLSDGPCLCDPDERECAIHTRLSVMLRDLPGLGVWRIDTSGYYAAVELQGAVQVIQMAAGRGQILPARLRLEQRTVKRIGKDGKPVTLRFAVPVLDVEITPGQLLGATQRPALTADSGFRNEAALDGSAAAQLAEIEAAPEPPRLSTPPRTRQARPPEPHITPVPDDVPTRQAGSIAEQVARAANPEPRKRRANAAQPVPRTGIQPRTAAQARAAVPVVGPPPADNPEPDPAPQEPEEEPSADPATDGQLKAVLAGFRRLGLDRAERLNIISRIVGRRVTTTRTLHRAEAAVVLDEIRAHEEALGGEPEPTPPEETP